MRFGHAVIGGTSGPTRNGAGQVGTGLAHMRTQDICYLFPATLGY